MLIKPLSERHHFGLIKHRPRNRYAMPVASQIAPIFTNTVLRKSFRFHSGCCSRTRTASDQAQIKDLHTGRYRKPFDRAGVPLSKLLFRTLSKAKQPDSFESGCCDSFVVSA